MKYEYTILSEGEKPYDGYDLRIPSIIPAVYIKSNIAFDNGNPYIEALPQPRTIDEVFSDYTRNIIICNPNDVAKMSSYEKICNITLLRELRYVLPFHVSLEEEFAMALLTSYRARYTQNFNDDKITIIQNNEESNVSCRLLGSNGAASNSSITLLGYSGCGKSASLEVLLANYPQIIEHHSNTMNHFIQIVYLVITCPANSNFSALYSSIGNEIDKLLGNVEPIYEHMISKHRTVGEKANQVCKLIELFGIGCIIFDEIQLISFESNKESSYDSLLTIVNKTKVALFTIGTEDAYHKMYPTLRTARRTGALIRASEYCESFQYFSTILTNLMKYQWFDTYVEPSSELIKAFYDVTKGVIAHLINMYIYMQLDYMRSANKPTIDVAYVKKISQRYFPGIEKFLNNLNDPLADKERKLLYQNAENQLAILLEEEKSLEIKKQFQNKINSEENYNRLVIKNNVIKNIQNTIDITGEVYNQAHIEDVVNRVMNQKNNEDATEEILTKKAYALLKKKTSDKRPGKKPKSKEFDSIHIAMRDGLLADEED